ncbi:MAG: long-chain-fatty-acid--CoA ligase, partial [Chloroflexota bacterium]
MPDPISTARDIENNDIIVANWISTHAKSMPEKIALRMGATIFSYADLAIQIEQNAAVLQNELGVTYGDRVAFLGYNSPEFLITFFACAKLGAIFVPLNWRLAPPEQLYILQDCTPTTLLLEADFSTLCHTAQDVLPSCQIVGLDFKPEGGHSLAALQNRVNPVASNADVDPESPILLVYTSGTTGHPKGAILTQKALYYNALNAIEMHALSRADHALNALPLFHVGGLNIQVTPIFYVGGTVTLLRHADPQQILRTIEQHKPTLTNLVPSLLIACIQSADWANTDVSSLQRIATGSTIVPQYLYDMIYARGIALAEVYGATETCPIAIHLPLDLPENKRGSVGLPARHCKVRIVDSDDQTLPAGEAGEILIKGPNLLQGYWNQPEATTLALRQGWYYTGDIGYYDEDGYYYIVDRKKNVIITGGENIYPAEIEPLLLEHPQVDDVAIIGLSDEQLQEVPVAVVVASPKASLTADELRAFLVGKIAAYKIPHHFIWRDELPKTALGKTQHFQLREQLQQDSGPVALKPNRKNDSTSKIKGALRRRLEQAPVTKQHDQLKRYIQTEIGVLMGVEPTSEQNLLTLGIDSLLSIQITNHLAIELDVTLPNTLVLQYPNLDALTQCLLNILTQNTSDSSAMERATQPQESLALETWFPQQYNQQEYYNGVPGLGQATSALLSVLLTN